VLSMVGASTMSFLVLMFIVFRHQPNRGNGSYTIT
jgi:hypothetical protein